MMLVGTLVAIALKAFVKEFFGAFGRKLGETEYEHLVLAVALGIAAAASRLAPKWNRKGRWEQYSDHLFETSDDGGSVIRVSLSQVISSIKVFHLDRLDKRARGTSFVWDALQKFLTSSLQTIEVCGRWILTIRYDDKKYHEEFDKFVARNRERIARIGRRKP